MLALIQRYTRWLHTQWPAGTAEKLPIAREDGTTNVLGLYIVGDLTGVPLLKFSAHTGTRAVQSIVADPAFDKRNTTGDTLDIAIIGGGVSGYAAAIEARKHNLNVKLFEAAEPFSTIANFPTGKPIYTYPTDMTPAGDLQFHEKSAVKEGLLEDLHEQADAAGITPTLARVDSVQRKSGRFEINTPDQPTITAHRVVVAIGRSGNFRKLGVPGEELPKVYNRLHDPRDFCGQNILVVGGGDSALETAIALTQCGSNVTLSYRKPEFARPKPDNVDKINQLTAHPDADFDVETVTGDRVTTPSGAYIKPEHTGSLTLMMASGIKQITEDNVTITDADKQQHTLPNDAVFTMIGREAPLDFFRRSGVNITGEWRPVTWLTLILFGLFCLWVYHWKADYLLPDPVKTAFNDTVGWNPGQTWNRLTGTAEGYFNTPGTLGHTLKTSASSRSFYYTLLYATAVTVFGIRRIRRRKTPYITRQTLTLTAIQVLPLFLLPEIILPLLGHNGAWDAGIGQWFANTFFPEANYGHGREYWRAYGFILAWPLMAWNWFTDQPMWGWLVLGFIQTFVFLPIIIRRWGKGAYCGWICSCGALAETLGDAHRHKMPHGPRWNRLNMIGQAFLLFAVTLMILRIVSWIIPGDDPVDKTFKLLSRNIPFLSYAYLVDLLWAGILGVAFYFHFSGRVWCRFACPLAALMHIYARFSQFRILADKKKCISCNVCTSVCHQGIDIMNFANKGLPMEDPQCVRCSACVQSCPTGVLTFGRVDRKTGQTLATDSLPASPVQIAELRINGQTAP